MVVQQGCPGCPQASHSDLPPKTTHTLPAWHDVPQHIAPVAPQPASDDELLPELPIPPLEEGAHKRSGHVTIPESDPEEDPDGAPELEEEPELEPVKPPAGPIEEPESGLLMDAGGGPPSWGGKDTEPPQLAEAVKATANRVTATCANELLMVPLPHEMVSGEGGLSKRHLACMPPRSLQRDNVAGLREPARLEFAGELGDDVPAPSLRGPCQRLRQRRLDVRSSWPTADRLTRTYVTPIG
jgi:hypothetical protein